MSTSRREFLKIGAMALLAPRALCEPSRPARTLVILQLAGGNDPLNTLVPYADARYRDLRPALAIPECDLLPVSDRFALHPAMAPLLSLYRRHALAFVPGVGFPSLDRSHFRAQEVWQTADESCGYDRRPRLGWIGRYADLYLAGQPSPLAVVALSDRTPAAAAAQRKPATVAADVRRFRVEELEALRGLYATPLADPLAEAIRAHGAQLFAAADELRSAAAPANAFPYPSSRLGSALRDTASLLAAHQQVAAVWITVGGFDTHSLQLARHAALLGDLAASLAAFHADLAARALSGRVAVLAWSEFGRRAAENGSAGTDHGKGGMVMLLGDGVKGGIHGEPPDFARLDDGDLPCAIDFRRVYAGVIEQWLDRDSLPVLGRRYQSLRLFV